MVNVNQTQSLQQASMSLADAETALNDEINATADPDVLDRLTALHDAVTQAIEQLAQVQNAADDAVLKAATATLKQQSDVLQAAADKLQKIANVVGTVAKIVGYVVKAISYIAKI